MHPFSQAVLIARALLASIKKVGVSYPDCFTLPFDESQRAMYSEEESDVTTNNFLVYPNTGSFILESALSSEQILYLSIVDVTGKVVHNEKMNGEPTQEINAPLLENGIYFLSVKDETGNLIYTTKISIMK